MKKQLSEIQFLEFLKEEIFREHNHHHDKAKCIGKDTPYIDSLYFEKLIDIRLIILKHNK